MKEIIEGLRFLCRSRDLGFFFDFSGRLLVLGNVFLRSIWGKGNFV